MAMNDLVKYNPLNSNIFSFKGFSSNEKFNRKHVIRYRWLRARIWNDLMTGKRFQRPDIFEIISWKWFGGEKPKWKRIYKFRPPVLFIWFADNEYPMEFEFQSNEAAEKAFLDFNEYMTMPT